MNILELFLINFTLPLSSFFSHKTIWTELYLVCGSYYPIEGKESGSSLKILKYIWNYVNVSWTTDSNKNANLKRLAKKITCLSYRQFLGNPKLSIHSTYLRTFYGEKELRMNMRIDAQSIGETKAIHLAVTQDPFWNSSVERIRMLEDT